MIFKKKLHVSILLAIILLGFLLRLYRFDGPVADWHSWRQADVASVSRNFAQNGFDLLHPRMDNISNVQSGLDNPEGYFFVEFPLYNAAQAGLFSLFGIFTIEQWGRLVSIISSTLAAIFLYLLVARHSNQTIGLFAAFFYALLPFNIYYGRVILADTSMVMAILGGIYFFDKWVEERMKYKTSHSGKRGTSASRIANVTAVRDSGQARMTLYYILAILLTAAAFLLKPSAVFFVLPMVYLAWQAFGLRLFLQWQLWFFAFIAIAPLAWWRTWMQQFPEGIPVNAWLFNGNGIRFRPAFFRWIFYERLTILISGYIAIILAFIGFYKLKALKEWLFFASFFVSSFIYVSIFATGNVQHDYYQIPIMPSVAIIFAIGSYFLYNWSAKNIPVGKVLLIIIIVSGFYFSWDRVKDYFNINNPSIIAAGEAVDRLTPTDAKVTANYNGDSAFLYQTKRKGWANLQHALPEMVEKGADYLVLVNPTKEDHVFAKDYKIVAETKEYLLFDLKKASNENY